MRDWYRTAAMVVGLFTHELCSVRRWLAELRED